MVLSQKVRDLKARNRGSKLRKLRKFHTDQHPRTSSASTARKRGSLASSGVCSASFVRASTPRRRSTLSGLPDRALRESGAFQDAVFDRVLQYV